MKRVVQYNIDILIKNEKENDINLEELITSILKENGVDVCGVCFADDVTKHYEDYLKD